MTDKIILSAVGEILKEERGLTKEAIEAVKSELSLRVEAIESNASALLRERIKELGEGFDERLSDAIGEVREDQAEAFSPLDDAVKEIKAAYQTLEGHVEDRTKNVIDRLESVNGLVADAVQESHGKTVEELTKHIGERLEKEFFDWRKAVENEIEGLTAEIQDKLDQVKDGRDGIDGKDGAPGRPGDDGVDADPLDVALAMVCNEEIVKLLTGAPGEKGDPGIDRITVSPYYVQSGDKLKKNDVAFYNNGLWQAIRKTNGTPEEDPGSYKPIVTGLADLEVTYSLVEREYQFKCRLSDGEVMAFDTPDTPRLRHSDDGMKSIAGDIRVKGSFLEEYNGTDWVQKVDLKGDKGEDGARGRKGIPGRDGVGIEDVIVTGNVVNILLTNGENKEFLIDIAVPASESIDQEIKRYAGRYKFDTPYKAGDVVSDPTGLYVALKNTKAKLGDTRVWAQMMGSVGGGGGSGGGGGAGVKTVANIGDLSTVAAVPGTLVYVLNTGTFKVADGGGKWQDIIPSPTDKTILQALVFDPVIGTTQWQDDRHRPATVGAVTDLYNIPGSHAAPGKIVYVMSTQEMFEFIATSTTMTGTSTDWRKIGGGSGSGVILAGRVGNLPLKAAGINAPMDKALGLVRFDPDGNPENRFYVYDLAADAWSPVGSRTAAKALRSDADFAGYKEGDVQTTLEPGHEEIKVADNVGALHTIFSADAVAAQIAAGNQFQGTVSDAGAAVVGSIQFTAMKAQSALQATDKSHYWIYVGTPGYTITNTDIGGANSAIVGGVLNVGDWIIVSDNGGALQYNIIPGDLLAKSRGDNLYGLNTWSAGGYEAGSIVVYNGKLYKSTGPVVAADAAPDQPGSPWAPINLSAGVSKVATDADLPAAAANGDVYLVLSSAQNGGGQAMFSWDQAQGMWTPLGGGAGQNQPMELAGGKQIIDIGVPIGSVIAYGSMKLPHGWLACDGSWINSAQHPKLVELLNPGNTSAQLPDLRDQFIRGANASLDKFTKHPFTTGLPRNPFQAAAAGSAHRHMQQTNKNLTDWKGGGSADHTLARQGYGADNDPMSQQFTKVDGAHTHSITGGDAETAPVHVRLLYIIKTDDHGMGRL